jgi:cell division protein FtsZ
MAIGRGDGQHPAIEAVEQAISNPLLNINMNGAKGVLLSFSGGWDMPLGEVNDAATLVAREADPNALIFFGMTTPTDELEGQAKVTLIATGIKMPVSGGWFADIGDSVRNVRSAVIGNKSRR